MGVQTPQTSKDGGVWARKICCMSAGKWCTLCAIASVVAMVSIPVGVLVVGPMVAQKILDGTTISLPNSTVSACATLEAWVQNNATINVPFFLPSTLLTYKQDLYIQCGGAACTNPNVTFLGSYDSPVMHLSGGESSHDFAARMDLKDLSVIMNEFLVPVFYSGEKIHLILDAKDVTISVLGISLKGLSMHKELTCSMQTQGPAVLGPWYIPNKACYPDKPDAEPYSGMGYSMSCVSGAQPLTSTATKNGAAIIL